MEKKLFDILKERGYVKDLTHEQEIIELQKEIPFYNQRLIVRPGITGWDQVSGEYHSPSKEDTYKKLQNDLLQLIHLKKYFLL